jgi:hypothetical protein
MVIKDMMINLSELIKGLSDKPEVTNPSETHERISQLTDDLQRTIEWIHNADIKNSILLSFIGIIMIPIIELLFSRTSNISISVNSLLLREQSLTFILYRFIIFVYLLLIPTTFLNSVFCFLSALYGRVNLKNIKNKNLIKHSLIFFGTISTMEYHVYKNQILNQRLDSRVDDLLSQIYINSVICSKKFKLYNQGLMSMSIFMLLVIVALIICVL